MSIYRALISPNPFRSRRFAERSCGYPYFCSIPCLVDFFFHYDLGCCFQILSRPCFRGVGNSSALSPVLPRLRRPCKANRKPNFSRCTTLIVSLFVFMKHVCFMVKYVLITVNRRATAKTSKLSSTLTPRFHPR